MQGLVLDHAPSLAPDERVLASAATNALPWWLNAAAWVAVVLLFAFTAPGLLPAWIAALLIGGGLGVTWLAVATTSYHVTTHRVVRRHLGFERSMPLADIVAVERGNRFFTRTAFGPAIGLRSKRLFARSLVLWHVRDADAFLRALDDARAALPQEAA